MNRIAGWGLFAVIIALLAGCSKVGETYVLSGDETLQGDQHLAVVDARLEAGSTVEGDLNITASDVTVDGLVEGDLTVIATHLTIGENAQIEGDLIYCLVKNGTFTQATNAVIWGEIRNSCSSTAATVNSGVDTDSLPVRLAQNIFFSVGSGLLAALVTMFFPQEVIQIRNGAYRHWVISLGLGILTLFVAVGLTSLWRLSLALVVPAILVPGIIGAWLAILAMSLAGSFAIAQPVGSWILRRLFGDQVPVITATVGTATLTFLVLVFRLIPGLAWISMILILLLASWSLGAALITRAGTREYVSRTSSTITA